MQNSDVTVQVSRLPVMDSNLPPYIRPNWASVVWHFQIYGLPTRTYLFILQYKL